MTALCLVAAEIPFLLCSLVFFRELSEKGLYKTVFAGAVVLCSVLFLLGLYFGAVLSKTFWLCEKVYFKNKKCSVALAVNKSKSLTEGNRFRLVNYNISFAFLHILNSASLHGAVHFTVKRIAVPRIYRKVQARCRLPGGFYETAKNVASK